MEISLKGIGKVSPDATLIIDPTLIFSSFTGSAGDNWGFTATYGPDGSFFGGGINFSFFGYRLLFEKGFVELRRQGIWKSASKMMTEQDSYVYDKYIRGVKYLITGPLLIITAAMLLFVIFFR